MQLGSRTFYPQQLRDNLLSSPTTNLRDHLNKKISAHQITQQCCYEGLIISILSAYLCSSDMYNKLVFKGSAALASKRVKRHHSCRKSTFSDRGFFEATSNITGHDKGKQLIVELENTNVMAPTGYRAITQSCESSKAHFFIVESQVKYGPLCRGRIASFKSSKVRALAYMASTHEDMAGQRAMQTQAQR